jgi:hypothetical protein
MWLALGVPVLIMMLALGMEGLESRMSIASPADPNEPDLDLVVADAAAGRRR